MKTVLGKVVSTKGVSLSKAARILSKFAFSDNGASPAFAAYLKRASASFDELVQFHKEIKGPGSEHKDRNKKHHSFSGLVNEEVMNSVKRPGEDNGFLNEEKQLCSGLKKRVDGGGKDQTKMTSDDVTVDSTMSSHGDVVDHGSSKEKKKKMDKDKGESIDGASNRTDSGIHGVDGAKERKVKKRRDKAKKEKSDGGDLKIGGVEGQNCPPGEGAAIQEATKIQENDGNEHKKHKKKKRKEHEKEESASIVGSKQKDQAGGNGDVDGYVSAKNQVDGEKKKREKKRAERKDDNKDASQEAIENNISRKRKHEGDNSDERLDNSEEQHRSKKNKK